MGPASAIEDVLNALDNANERMLDGDGGAWKALLSHRDDVNLLGAYGGLVQGWTDVSARFDRTAAGYAGAGTRTGTTARENIATWIGTDLACVVDLERHHTLLDANAEPVTFVYRTTHVLRRENGEWKIVLRHADPLATFRGPDFAHTAAR
jgi:ketosteroid isomerase-like protein